MTVIEALADAGADSNSAVDPFLTLPLHGVHLIEASAGTGKTFTLATLVTRLVVEQTLRIGQILAVTFTDAATQELRRRIRERLSLAADCAARIDDAFDHAPPEQQLTVAIIRRHLAATTESATALARRLQRAALEIDLAAIFTIHGFCRRVLAEHALESAHGFGALTLLTSDRELLEQIAADLWRAFGVDPDDAQGLQSLWPAPDALSADLRDLLRYPQLEPSPMVGLIDPLPTLRRTATDLRAAFIDHGEQLHADLHAALAHKVLNGRSYTPDLIDAVYAALQRWCACEAIDTIIEPRLERLTPTFLAAKANKGRDAQVPSSPLCEAVAAHLAALAQHAVWRDEQRMALLRRLRDEARLRLIELKQRRRVQTYDDLIDDVAAALEGEQGAALAARLRDQYAAALVDEFQDTDERQWSIFARVFAQQTGEHAPPLLLIGDPKQAIYSFRGGDVHTYLRARQHAQSAPPLECNFRSRPSLLRAVATLYDTGGIHAFGETAIAFQPMQPGGRVADDVLLRQGVPAPALCLQPLPAPDEGKQHSAGDSRALAIQACATAIHNTLREAGDGLLLLHGRPVQPGDIAVLVRNHHEASGIQRALAELNIPAVAAGKRSLFDTEEARELLTLFDAMLRPDDESRLRAALATVLLGLDAAAIAALDHDDVQRSHWQLQLLHWRERWQRHGPFAWVNDIASAHAERLLGLADGERRLTNLLQLGERLQEMDTRSLGDVGLIDAFRLTIAEADANDETQLLRLESDAHRVQIVTLHKSKGLEYPLVFLPFAGIGATARAPSRHCVVAQGEGRVLHWKLDGDDPRWTQALNKNRREQAAEDARLLYVGLTRAQHALWLASGAIYRYEASALAPLLGDLQALRAHPDVRVEAEFIPALLPPLSPERELTVHLARQPVRSVPRDWWVYSFTQLANETSGGPSGSPAAETASSGHGLALNHVNATAGIELAPLEERGAQDEALRLTAVALPGDPRFSGSRFGNALHAALEQVDFAAWRDWRGTAPPEGEVQALQAALQGEGYVEADIDDGIAHLAPLIGHTLNQSLPEGVRLCDVAAEAKRMEMEFHFAMQATSTSRLLALLHQHGVLRERHAFGSRQRLEGLMTGKIDLVYAHKGQYFVLDYKSNRLPAYDCASLSRAMDDSEYRLQALIYTLALHRWLRFRLGEGYDYARDLGGVRYLFCRGLDLQPGDEAPGVFAWQPAPALVTALDRMFAGEASS